MNSLGTELSKQLADSVEQASASIVRVQARKHLASSGIVFAEGIVITAAHTVHRSDGIRVTLPNGETVEGTLAGRDESTDIAVLHVDAVTTPIVWSEAPPRAGEIVIAAGRPGRGARAAVGFVTGVGGPWRTRDGGRIDAIVEVEASLPPGFSGGPLLAVDGRALGMNTSRLVRGGTTIPHATLDRVTRELFEHGTIRRPALGIAVYPVERGLVVLSVQQESAASSAGILVGDVLQAIGPTELTDPHALREALQSLNLGDASTLRITRGGEVREVGVRM
jgi:serine protease DegQ